MRRTICLISFVLLAACAPPGPRWQLARPDLQGVQDQAKLDDLANALHYQLDYLVRQQQKTPTAQILIGGERFLLSQLQSAYQDLADYVATQPSPTALLSWCQEHFRWYRYFGKASDGTLLVTSYYVGAFAASLTRTARFTTPIYPLPPGSDGQVYSRFTREQIEYEDALQGIVEPLAWMENEMDRFFLQVQGSGELVLEDGTRLMVGYHGNNGYPFVALGKLLLEDQVVPRDQMSMQGIRNYFVTHPGEFRAYARRLPRTIFFRIKPYAETTIGTPVSPLRTIAVDPEHIPFGMIGFLQTQQPQFSPEQKYTGTAPINLLVASQDTGGGIRQGHIDLFWGFGDEAALHAGSMKNRGVLYLLLPK